MNASVFKMKPLVDYVCLHGHFSGQHLSLHHRRLLRGQGRRVGKLPTSSSPFLPLGHKGRTGGRFRPAGFPSLRIPTGCCGGGVRVDAGHVPLLEIVIAVSSENTVKYGTV